MATKPSLALIPSGIKQNKVYSVLPSNGDGDFTFSRSGNATRVNKDGFIEEVGSGIPRLNYPLIEGEVSGCPSLLLEPQRTNLTTYSEDFSDPYWFKNDATVVGGFSAPDGTNNAFKLVEGTANGEHYTRHNFINTTDGGKISASVFVKAGTRSEVTLKENAYTGQYLTVDLVNETFITTGISANIQKLANGWFRINIISNGRPSTRWKIMPSVNGITTYQGDGTSSLYIWGFQLEDNVSYATSYIPTSGGVVTRVYDTMPTYLDVTPLNIGNSYTLFLDADLNVNDNNKVFGAINNSVGGISFTMRNNFGGIRLYNHIDGSYPVSGITSSTNKFVIRVDGNSYKVFVQGSSLSGTLTTQRDLGSLNFYGQNTELKINNFKIYDTALSDAECEALVN